MAWASGSSSMASASGSSSMVLGFRSDVSPAVSRSSFPCVQYFSAANLAPSPTNLEVPTTLKTAPAQPVTGPTWVPHQDWNPTIAALPAKSLRATTPPVAAAPAPVPTMPSTKAAHRTLVEVLQTSLPNSSTYSRGTRLRRLSHSCRTSSRTISGGLAGPINMSRPSWSAACSTPSTSMNAGATSESGSPSITSSRMSQASRRKPAAKWCCDSANWQSRSLQNQSTSTAIAPLRSPASALCLRKIPHGESGGQKLYDSTKFATLDCSRETLSSSRASVAALRAAD
mmetsp:Transcript_27180/g.65616  ORF Transcript_27180/g.65616 Transcript_27180/m.65616 type:complete len:285 (+) Transcript_27180:3-857(+)